jgi:hypothetical protein
MTQDISQDSDAAPVTAGTHSSAEIEAIHVRLDAGDDRMARIEANLKTNTEATARVEGNTSDLVDLFASARGAFKVLEGLGKLAKPAMYITGATSAVLTLWVSLKGLIK